MKYEIILEKEEDGRFSAHVPMLPGCHSWGHTREEAVSNIKEAMEGYLEVLNNRLNAYRATGESMSWNSRTSQRNTACDNSRCWFNN